MAASSDETYNQATIQDSELATYLINLSRDSLTVVNNKDFDHKTPLGLKVKSHIAPDYIASIDNVIYELSFEQTNAVWAEWAELEPRLEFRPTNDFWVDLDASKGRAIVHQQLEIHGMLGTYQSTLKGIGAQYFRLDKDGKWVLYKLVGIRSGEVDDGLKA